MRFAKASVLEDAEARETRKDGRDDVDFPQRTSGRYFPVALATTNPA
jgi:hypothetical protein